MRCAIYGAGSLGTVMGAFLTKNGVEIDLVESSVVPWVNVNAVHEVYNW